MVAMVVGIAVIETSAACAAGDRTLTAVLYPYVPMKDDLFESAKARVKRDTGIDMTVIDL